jgi:hypothetical protein
MGRQDVPDGDPFTTVIGQYDNWYPCPDTATVDHHLVELAPRIGQAGRRSPKLAEAYRADMDLLLDRRSWLSMLEEESASEAA